MKRNLFLLLFFIAVQLGAFAQHALRMGGATFNVAFDNKNMTAEIVDYEYRIDDREYPMYGEKRKFPDFKRIQNRTLKIPATVVIGGYEYTITSIGKAAFAGYSNVDQIVIPNTVQSIGDYAFFRSSLVSVEIPESVLSIGNRAFGYCNKLKKLTLPNATIQLGENLYAESKDCELVYAQVSKKNATASASNARPVKRELPRHTIPSSDVDIDIPSASKVNDNTFAIIIANENYQSEEAVHYALNDGRTFKNYCQSVLGIPEENIRLREDATLNNIQAELDWIGKVAKVYEGQANIIIYYAGHGVPDEATKGAYLLPVDGVGHNVKTGYSLEALYATLGAMPAKTVTVFMDACFCGTLRGDGMLAAARGVAIYVEEEAPQGNMVVFSAAQGDETAYPYAEKGHGLFTYYLLKKLKETKGNVSYGELATYLTQQVSRRSIVVNNKSQTPVTSASVNMDGKWQKLKLK